MMTRVLTLSKVKVKVAIVAMDRAEVVPETVATTPNQGTQMAIVSTVVNSISQRNALSMAKSAKSITNSITFRICATRQTLPVQIS